MPWGCPSSPASASPPKAQSLSPWRGDRGSARPQHLVQHGGAELFYRSFPPRFSPLRLSQPSRVSQPQLLARVPSSHQAHRAGGTLKKGLLTRSSFGFADQRRPRSRSSIPGEQEPEEQPFAGPAVRVFAGFAGGSHDRPFSFGGREGGSRAPSVPGREREKRCPRSPAP